MKPAKAFWFDRDEGAWAYTRTTEWGTSVTVYLYADEMFE